MFPWIVLFLCLGTLAFVRYAAWRVGVVSEGRVHASVADVPARKVGLVLGCVSVLPNGRENTYFRFRVRAAADLFHAGKVRFLLVSGDNHRHGYDEPSDMRAALVALGVPEDRIVSDYAGFRTLDSVVRAKKVFQLDEAVVVSQDWHCARAIYLARAHGLDLVGYAAKEVRGRAGWRTRLREQVARAKAVADIAVLRTQPRFLGPTEVIPE